MEKTLYLVLNMSNVEKAQYVVKVGDKVIKINEETLRIINEYIHRPMSLEELASRLGLDSWEEAYEFIKKIPAWLMWTPPSLWRFRVKWFEEKEGKETN